MNNKPLEREPIDRVRARLEALLKANAAPQATAGGWSKMSDEPLAREREPIERVRARLGHSLGRTPLLAAGLDPSERACHAARRPCRTGDARFMAARVRGRGRRRA